MTSWWYVEFEDGRHVKQLAFRLSSGSTGVPKCIQIAHGGATVCCRYQSMEVNLWILVVQVILRMIMHGETSWCTPLCERFMQFRSRSPRSWRSAVLWLWLVRCSRKLLAPGPCGANPYCSYPAFASSLVVVVVVVVEHVDWIDYLANLISSKQSWFDVVLFISYWLGETMRLRPWHSTEIDCKLARRQHKTAWHNMTHSVYICIHCYLMWLVFLNRLRKLFAFWHRSSVKVHCSDVYHGCEEVQADVAYVLAEPLRWLQLVDEHRATRTWAPNFASPGWCCDCDQCGPKLPNRLNLNSGSNW